MASLKIWMPIWLITMVTRLIKMNLPRLYLMTKTKRRVQQKTVMVPHLQVLTVCLPMRCNFLNKVICKYHKNYLIISCRMMTLINIEAQSQIYHTLWQQMKVLLSQGLWICILGLVEALQIPPDVITGSKDLVCSELKSQCAICKEGILPTDMVARPNNCLHMFHSACIDEWLKVDDEGITCPICETCFTSTIMCSMPEELSKAKLFAGLQSQEIQEPSSSISADIQPLVFEEYMDNGREPVKLYG